MKSAEYDKYVEGILDSLHAAALKHANSKTDYEKACHELFVQEHEISHDVMISPEEFGIKLGGTVTEKQFKAIYSVDDKWRVKAENRLRSILAMNRAEAEHEYWTQRTEILKCTMKTN